MTESSTPQTPAQERAADGGMAACEDGDEWTPEGELNRIRHAGRPVGETEKQLRDEISRMSVRTRGRNYVKPGGTAGNRTPVPAWKRGTGVFLILFPDSRSEMNRRRMKMTANRNEIPYKIYLTEDEMPKQYYNVRADMKEKPAPLLNPATHQPMTAEELEHVFCRELVEQELDNDTAYFDIPQEIRDFYKIILRIVHKINLR